MSVAPAEIISSRQTIDEIDHAIIELLARRREVVKELFAKKRVLGLPFFDAAREAELLEERREHARSRGVSPEFVEVVFLSVLDDSHSIAMDG